MTDDATHRTLAAADALLRDIRNEAESRRAHFGNVNDISFEPGIATDAAKQVADIDAFLALPPADGRDEDCNHEHTEVTGADVCLDCGAVAGSYDDDGQVSWWRSPRNALNARAAGAPATLPLPALTHEEGAALNETLTGLWKMGYLENSDLALLHRVFAAAENTAPATDEDEFIRGVESVTAIRCTEHYAAPIQNATANGSECGVCVAVERDSTIDAYESAIREYVAGKVNSEGYCMGCNSLISIGHASWCRIGKLAEVLNAYQEFELTTVQAARDLAAVLNSYQRRPAPATTGLREARLEKALRDVAMPSDQCLVCGGFLNAHEEHGGVPCFVGAALAHEQGAAALSAPADAGREAWPSVADALAAALEGAIGVIKTWHDLGSLSLPESAVERAWLIYYENSPEMKGIRAALDIHAKAAGREAGDVG